MLVRRSYAEGSMLVRTDNTARSASEPGIIERKYLI
jgi:hypothetical protein